jgi:septum site-determining protein MinD
MVKKGTVIGVISIKGGVGKTTTVSNLGAIFSKDFGQKVLIVDANISAPNLGLHLGIVDPGDTLNDVLGNKVAVNDAIYEYTEGLHIIPSSIRTRKLNLSAYTLRNKLKPLKSKYDLILLDSSPNLNSEILCTMGAADELLVVSSPDYPTLSTTIRAVKLAKEENVPIKGLILNRVYGKKFELSLDEIEAAAEVPVLAVLPNDLSLAEAVANTMPGSHFNPRGRAVIEYKKLAAALIGQSYQDPRIGSKIKKAFRRFSNKIPKEELNRSVISRL